MGCTSMLVVGCISIVESSWCINAVLLRIFLRTISLRSAHGLLNSRFSSWGNSMGSHHEKESSRVPGKLLVPWIVDAGFIL